ncbi:MAG: 3-oxoacyl-[acyl-carrier-protein] reductase [Phycisphaeraceae bacterium]|nr:3-oxoacyl-[acyl-carrier-protein] reductase [Phycisphaeraceae bacterium]
MSETNPQRVAIVTGASRGIGAEIAVSLAGQGRHVVLVARDEAKLESVSRRIADEHDGASSIHPCDVSRTEALEQAVEQVASEHGRLDILVNNAGISRDNLMLRMTDEEFDEVIAVNLRAVFVACRTALRPMMRGQWGRIINVGSVSGLVGNAGQANYAASKAGLIGLTRSLAKEMARKNITANVVAPGFIETDMTEVLPDAVKEAALQVTPLRRFGRGREIAAAVAYLASDDAGYTTGQVLTVDGGMTMV